jgi:hypothetical protein
VGGPTAELGLSVQFCITTPFCAGTVIVQSDIFFPFAVLGMHTAFSGEQ